ncbi:response regulator transcription factor [Nonlabens ponticola]|uniref:Response regulator transcription factor n=1 Tax=Nonlabens ponticola TaxID=2496866 RepID=A0A3S9MZB7_9FLAO|nr:response regulator transcription factor [Nonlabens ponticola]AZQ44606.1 response regulator transcription factor [Nonlabens ponticola]
MIQLMIVEDHKSLIDGLELLIKNDPDIEVVATATDGTELLKILEHKKAHLILTDISMPKMNGIELCTQVKEKYPAVKVVAFTMFDDATAVKDMLQAGADGYLLKTRSLQEVLESVKKVMQGETVVDASIDPKLAESTTVIDDDILSRSEREILKLIAAGNNSTEIAAIRHTAVSTIHKHRKNMIMKLGLHGKGELLRYALQKHAHYR